MISALRRWNRVATSFRAISGETSVSSFNRLDTQTIAPLRSAAAVVRDQGLRILTIKH